MEVAEARQALDRGRRLAARGTPVDAIRSLQEFRHALSIDPEYAEAWAGLAEVHAMLGWNNWSDPAAATIRLGLGETDAALTLLELAAERRSLRLAAILEDPCLRQLRDKTRFKALLAGMALPLGDDQ